MGHSQAEKAQSRERIIAAAARQIREGGLDSVSIADLMKQAKLTHGGFYGHFQSRSELMAAALERALADGEAASTEATGGDGPKTLKAVLNSYLSPAHRDNAGGGCAIAAVAGDVAGAEDLAAAAWCAMVGAVVLSRVFKGEEGSDAILRQARKAILQLEELARA